MFKVDESQILLMQKEIRNSHTRLANCIREICHSLLYLSASEMKMDKTVQKLLDNSRELETNYRKVGEQLYNLHFILNAVIVETRRANNKLQGMTAQIF